MASVDIEGAVDHALALGAGVELVDLRVRRLLFRKRAVVIVEGSKSEIHRFRLALQDEAARRAGGNLPGPTPGSPL